MTFAKIIQSKSYHLTMLINLKQDDKSLPTYFYLLPTHGTWPQKHYAQINHCKAYFALFPFSAYLSTSALTRNVLKVIMILRADGRFCQLRGFLGEKKTHVLISKTLKELYILN